MQICTPSSCTWPPFFLKPNLNSGKKKNEEEEEVQKKILVFNLRNKKLINQILKNHKQKKGANKTW